MTTALTDVCTDLAAWLPVVSELVPEPDTAGYTETRGQPGSRPPWNPQAANAKYDLHALARHAEQLLRLSVTGTITRRPGSDTATCSALDAIPKLAAAADDDLADDICRQLSRALTRILQLPAIDLEQRPRVIDCPRCSRKMLRYWENRDEVACCGCMQKATISIGYVSGEPILTWADGWMP